MKIGSFITKNRLPLDGKEIKLIKKFFEDHKTSLVQDVVLNKEDYNFYHIRLYFNRVILQIIITLNLVILVFAV